MSSRLESSPSRFWQPAGLSLPSLLTSMKDPLIHLCCGDCADLLRSVGLAGDRFRWALRSQRLRRRSRTAGATPPVVSAARCGMDPPCHREHDALVLEHGGRLGGSPPRPAGRGLDLPGVLRLGQGSGPRRRQHEHANAAEVPRCHRGMRPLRPASPSSDWPPRTPRFLPSSGSGRNGGGPGCLSPSRTRRAA